MFCLAVPGTLTELKAVVSSFQSVLISWRPPSQPNGIITKYTVYSRENDATSETKMENVPPEQTHLVVNGLKQNKPYEFWVTASTIVGEGESSKRIIAIPKEEYPVKIATFDDKFVAIFGKDIKLPCLAVGASTFIKWKVCANGFKFF